MVLNNIKLSKNLIEILFVFFPIALLFSNIISELILFIFIITYLVLSKIDKIIKNLKEPIILFLLFFWAYLLLNYFINLDKSPSLERTIFFVRFPLLILAISFFVNSLEINLRKIFIFWLIIMLVVCFDLFVQKFTLSNIFGYKAVPAGAYVYRLGGFMDQELKISNFIFHIGSLTFVYFFSKTINENNKLSFLNFIFLILLIVSIFFTAERSNFLTIISFTILFIFILSFKKIKVSLSLFLILLLLFLSTLKNDDSLSLRMTNQLIEKIKLLKYEPGKNYLNKSSHYFTHASVAYQIYKNNKLFGVGTKNFRNFCDNSNFDKDIHPAWQKMKCSTHPHNFYFEMLAELGIIGLIILLSFFIFSLSKFFNSYLKNKDYFLILNFLIILVYFIPILPRGSFFTNWNAIIFWTIFSFAFAKYKELQKIK